MYSVDHGSLHSLPSTELHRDTFPPYVSPNAKRSTAVVVPSVARTQPNQLSTSMARSAAVSLLRFPSTSYQRQPALSPVSSVLLHPPEAAQASAKVIDCRRKHSSAGMVNRSASARSLLAPSTAGSGGISYSLVQSSALSTTSHSAVRQTGLPQGTQSHQLSPARNSVLFSDFFPPAQGTSGANHAALLADIYSPVAKRTSAANPVLLSEVYPVVSRTSTTTTPLLADIYSTVSRRSAANTAVTVVSQGTVFSDPLVHGVNFTRYHPYPEPNQISQSTTSTRHHQHHHHHYHHHARPADVFASASVPNISSQLQHSSSGRSTVEI